MGFGSIWPYLCLKYSKIKETLFIRDLKPTLNDNIGSEKLSIRFISSHLFPFHKGRYCLVSYQYLALYFYVPIMFSKSLSEDACWCQHAKRQVNFRCLTFFELLNLLTMRSSSVFMISTLRIAAVCILFDLVKLKWPKNKSLRFKPWVGAISDTNYRIISAY